MNTLTDLTQIWIGELSRFREMFLAWFNNSLLSGLTVKKESLVSRQSWVPKLVYYIIFVLFRS